MKLFYLFFLAVLFFAKDANSQNISIHSISTARQPSGDNGYTLDGHLMNESGRKKLLNPINFGENGIYNRSVSIFDGYASTGSLTNVSSISKNNIFFFASFNKNDPSTQAFTDAEIDSIYNWSVNGGKLIIASGGEWGPAFNSNVLNNKWGYSYIREAPSPINPIFNGNNTDIFNGPFGNVTNAIQGGSAQGYFTQLTSNAIIYATDLYGNPTLFMDCNTLDLIIADIDVFTIFGGISVGDAINNNQDKLLANTFAFMNKLQAKPKINASNNNELSLNDVYNSYQWFFNNAPLNGEINPKFNAKEIGEYYAEVTVNGGCKVKSDKIVISNDTLALPNVFSPNADGVNDNFIPIKMNGMKINQISIFNRWGEIMFKKDAPAVLWDGKKDGQVAPDGTYFWTLEYQNSKGEKFKKTGYVQLLK
jgi:gliding motility-associated-like protein